MQRFVIYQGSDGLWNAYEIETITPTDFRILGGEFGMGSLVFSRTENDPIAATFPGRWMLGVWEHNVAPDWEQTWICDIEGRLVIVNRSTLGGQEVILEGTWSITPSTSTFLVSDAQLRDDAPKSGSYPLLTDSLNCFKLDGSNDGLLYSSWESLDSLLVEDSNLLARQYSGPETTIVLTETGPQDFSFEYRHEGVLLTFRAENINTP